MSKKQVSVDISEVQASGNTACNSVKSTGRWKPDVVEVSGNFAVDFQAPKFYTVLEV